MSSQRASSPHPVFLHRGVVEGFYGTPWSHADRLWWLERLGRWGMNRYVHAPKDDPLQRAQWRDPYPPETLREFAQLVERGRAAGVEVGFAVSPGLSIEYASARDVAALCRKLGGFRELGARFFSLALDDVPARLVHEGDRRAFASLAEAHVALAHALREALGDDVMLWLVPTDYLGVEATDYLGELGAALDPAVEVGWTGRTVVSPTLRGEEAALRAATLRRKLLVWDNVPVADGPMRPMLHLGPFVGRDPGLAEHASGFLLNPMQHARASAVTVATAAAWLRDPQAYDAERAWEDAVAELGAGAGEAFRLFALAHRFSALAPDDRDRELEAAIDALRDAPGDGPALDRVRAALDARAEAGVKLGEALADLRLRAEIEPWRRSHRAETERMRAALDLLDALAREPGHDAGMGLVLALFRCEGRLTRTPPQACTSYGPRRVLYPQLASMGDRSARLGADPALFVDRCLADELVAFAEARALERLGPRDPDGRPNG